jgi:hypothetical protein
MFPVRLTTQHSLDPLSGKEADAAPYSGVGATSAVLTAALVRTGAVADTARRPEPESVEMPQATFGWDVVDRPSWAAISDAPPCPHLAHTSRTTEKDST